MQNYFLRSMVPVAIVTLLICNMLTGHVQTRDSLLRIYNNETIQAFGKSYVKGSKQLRFWDLKPEFTSGITKDMYKRSKNNLLLSRLFTITSLAALVSSAIIKKDNSGAGVALSIAGIGLNLGGLHFRKRSKEIIDRAIWQRNKEILFGVQ